MPHPLPLRAFALPPLARGRGRDQHRTPLALTPGRPLARGWGRDEPRRAPAPRPRRRWAGAALAAGGFALVALSAGCGYRPVYGGEGARYDVVAGRYGTASFEAVHAAVAGARSELGAARALGDGFPRVVIEVLRVDERSLGVRTSNDDLPLARGTEIIVRGRAQVYEQQGAPPSIDTGDMSRAAEYAAASNPTADAAARSRAVRDAARKLGQALGRAVLGLPEPSEVL